MRLAGCGPIAVKRLLLLVLVISSALDPGHVAAAQQTAGALFDDVFPSPILGASMRYRVYLPPDYPTDDARRYPVLYMLHGAGANYTEWSESLLPERTDALIVGGEIQPMIVVMPDDGNGQSYWANWAGDGPRWSDYVIDDVVGAIDARYRTLPVAASRALGGLSMGGLGALHIAMRRPDVFGVVGAHSPSIRLEREPEFWFLPGDAWNEHSPIWLARNAPDIERLQIWADIGIDDIYLDNVTVLHQTLLRRGVAHQWRLFGGEHEADYWLEHVPDYLRFYSSALLGA
jgi:enterochelin esterase-like enzyme